MTGPRRRVEGVSAFYDRSPGAWLLTIALVGLLLWIGRATCTP